MKGLSPKRLAVFYTTYQHSNLQMFSAEFLRGFVRHLTPESSFWQPCSVCMILLGLSLYRSTTKAKRYMRLQILLVQNALTYRTCSFEAFVAVICALPRLIQSLCRLQLEFLKALANIFTPTSVIGLFARDRTLRLN